MPILSFKSLLLFVLLSVSTGLLGEEQDDDFSYLQESPRSSIQTDEKFEVENNSALPGNNASIKAAEIVPLADYVPANDVDFRPLTYLEIANHAQRRVKQAMGTVRIFRGNSPYYAFKLPSIKIAKTLNLSSIYSDKKVFYPIVILLDADHQVRTVSYPEVKVSNMGFANDAIRLNIEVTPEDAYLLVTSKPEMFNQGFINISQQRSSSTVMVNNTVYYTPVTSQLVADQYFFSDQGKLEIITARKSELRPVRRHLGGFSSIGASAGGQLVAKNPEGDNFNAGGGAILTLGYAKRLSFTESAQVRGSLGYRIQGGNQGVIVQANVLQEFDSISLGGGLYMDLLNSVKHPEGGVTKFENAAGYQLVADYKAGEFFAFTLRYVFIDYESKQGVAFEGEQVAFDMMMYF